MPASAFVEIGLFSADADAVGDAAKAGAADISKARDSAEPVNTF